MTHPDHDQVIGRLVSARLRAGGIAAEPCPDAELVAAYVDGGLATAEVEAVERHLAGCGACRQLVGLLAGDDGVEAPAVVEPVGPAVVLPFRPRVTWAWMSLAAGILGAVTLWTVVRLDRAPESSLAERVAPATPAAYPPDRVGATGGATAPAAPAASAPKSAPPAELAARQAVPTAAAAPHGKDLASADQRTAADGASNPEAYLQSRLALADAAKAIDAAKRRSDEAASGRAAGAIAAAEPVPPPSPPPMARPPAQQTNTAAAGLTRARGPLAQNAVQNQEQSQAFAQPQTSPVGQAAGQSAAPSAAAAPTPVPAPAVASTPTAAGERAARLAKAAPPVAQPSAPAPRPAEMRERDTRGGAARAERAAAAAAPAAGAPPAAVEEEKADAFRSAPAGVPLARIALDASAPIAFAEPDGRLQWRIAGGNRIESSSDAGLTWARRHTARARLLAGSAPSIDVAWVVGERGLVLRRAVPGDWTAVAPPATVALIGVTATSATQARVLAADGRRFETTDGGQTWAPVEAADR